MLCKPLISTFLPPQKEALGRPTEQLLPHSREPLIYFLSVDLPLRDIS